MTHTKDGFPLTEEQAAVINSKIVPGTIKKVVAGAGTGKSTVLESFAENNTKVIQQIDHEGTSGTSARLDSIDRRLSRIEDWIDRGDNAAAAKKIK